MKTFIILGKRDAHDHIILIYECDVQNNSSKWSEYYLTCGFNKVHAIKVLLKEQGIIYIDHLILDEAMFNLLKSTLQQMCKQGKVKLGE